MKFIKLHQDKQEVFFNMILVTRITRSGFGGSIVYSLPHSFKASASTQVDEAPEEIIKLLSESGSVL